MEPPPQLSWEIVKMEESERNFISEIKVIGIVGYPPPSQEFPSRSLFFFLSRFFERVCTSNHTLKNDIFVNKR